MDVKNYVGQFKEKKTPVVSTVDGRAELIVPDAGSDQTLPDRLERAETVAAIRQGRDQFERGEGIPLKQAERRLRKS